MAKKEEEIIAIVMKIYLFKKSVKGQLSDHYFCSILVLFYF